MFDLPNNPTSGQITTGPGGAAYRWDGVKWVASTSAFMAEAPSDGTLYGRRNAAWSNLSVADLAALGEYNDQGRNLVHNALFNIQQRGAGPWTVGAYTADRWNFQVATDTVSWSVVALADADRAAIGDEAALSALQNVFTGSSTAGAFNLLTHRFEGVRRYANRTLTVSFWARYTTGTPKLGICFTQVFGTGGSPSANVSVAGQALTITGSWARYTLTFTIPSAAGKTFGTTAGTDFTQLEVWLSDQGTYASRSANIGVQSGTVQIWGVQVEQGSVVTPLVKRDAQQDLALCQRFYQVLQQIACSGYGVASATLVADISFPVQMRAVPTVVFAFVSYSNASGLATNAAFTNHLRASATVTAAGAGYAYADVQLSADL